MERGHAPPRGAPVIRFAPAPYDELRRHGERCWPEESCGVLLGRVEGGLRRVTLALRCRNADPAPRVRYALDPCELLAAVKLARARGEEVVGFYHSHPGGPARPSAADLEEAYWPGCAYVVTAVDDGRAGETRGFLLSGREEERRFAEEPVERGLQAEAGEATLAPGGAPAAG